MERRQLFKAAALAAAGLAAPASVRAQAPGRGRASRPDLFVRDWGEGPALLFLHGWGLAFESWNYVMQPLVERGFRCVAYDMRGHGRSPDPGRGYEFDTMADDLAGIIASHRLRDVTLIGHSFASGTIVRYMTRHRGAGVARLVFAAPAATPFLLRTADNPRGLPEALFAENRARMLEDFPAWMAANEAPFWLPNTSDAMKRWSRHMMDTASFRALMECNKAMTRTDFRPELPRVARPGLVIHGTADASVPLDFTGRPTAEAIPGARLTVYEGAPHGLIITHAARLANDIATFAREG
ncbi:alpha/beta fold hydrolase [Sphingosinicella sp.]|uniref:alpha/beta fold hydrolase n=1 Tax=Sphingosinicella sp. TaxID=1917971 RepID=UPI004037715A